MKLYIGISILILAILAPGVYGIDLKVSEGNSGSLSSASMTYGAGTKDIVEQSIKMNPMEGKMANSWHFTGPGSTYRDVNGYYGGYARSGFSITGSSADTYYDFSSSSYPYALQSESLSSSNAKDIFAYAYSRSNNGDFAEAIFEVNSPYYNGASLLNYWNYAYGTNSYALVQQGAGSAYAYGSTGYIASFVYADDVSDTSYVFSGSYNYPYLYSSPCYSGWTSTAYANRYSDITSTYQSEYMYGYPIYVNSYADGHTLPKYYVGYGGLAQWSGTNPTTWWVGNYP